MKKLIAAFAVFAALSAGSAFAADLNTIDNATDDVTVGVTVDEYAEASVGPVTNPTNITGSNNTPTTPGSIAFSILQNCNIEATATATQITGIKWEVQWAGQSAYAQSQSQTFPWLVTGTPATTISVLPTRTVAFQDLPSGSKSTTVAVTIAVVP